MSRPAGEKAARRARWGKRVTRRRKVEIRRPHCRPWQVLVDCSCPLSQMFNTITIFELVCLLSDWTRAFNPFIYVWLKCDLWKSTVICSDQSTISGNVGKELNQLISMMNNEDGGEGESWRITFMFNILFHYHNLFFYLVVIFDWVNFWCIPSMKQLFEIQHLTNPISLIIF